MEKRIYPGPIETVVTPEPFARQSFTDAGEAVAALEAALRPQHRLPARFLCRARRRRPSPARAATAPSTRRSASPTSSFAQIDSRLAYGHMPSPGHYATTITRPDLFESYLHRAARADHAQSRRAGHRVGIGDADPAALRLPRRHPCRGARSPTRSSGRCATSSTCPTSTAPTTTSPTAPSSRCPASRCRWRCSPRQRIDYSLHRLSHYTGTSAEHFQNFVLFTNYQFYIDEFVRLGARADGQGRRAATPPSSSRAT